MFRDLSWVFITPLVPSLLPQTFPRILAPRRGQHESQAADAVKAHALWLISAVFGLHSYITGYLHNHNEWFHKSLMTFQGNRPWWFYRENFPCAHWIPSLVVAHFPDVHDTDLEFWFGLHDWPLSTRNYISMGCRTESRVWVENTCFLADLPTCEFLDQLQIFPSLIFFLLYGSRLPF